MLSDGILTKIEYDLVVGQDDDEFAILDFRAELGQESSTSDLLIFNKTVSSLSESNIYVTHTSAISPGGPSGGSSDYEWSCECVDAEPPAHVDCTKRSVSNFRFCGGGIECIGCSVVLKFLSLGKTIQESQVSAVIIPHN